MILYTKETHRENKLMVRKGESRGKDKGEM